MWDLTLTLLFPRRCVFCGRFGRYLCPKCQEKIKHNDSQVCPVCERPAIDGATHPRCQTKLGLDGLTSLFVYEGPIKKAVKELKYRFVTDSAKELVSVTEKYHFISSSLSNCILTPVPLHSSRERWRGFNQSEIIGKLMAQKLRIKFVSDILIRQHATRPQVELKGKERQENIKNAFCLNPKHKLELKDWNLIIFDDVWTTGSTLKACGRILKQAGAKKVWGMTLAR